MKSRLSFYVLMAVLVVLNAVLLRSPNLLGKIGLWIYKYHYLRTFPKALLTVSLVIGTSVFFSEAIRFAVKKELLKRIIAHVLFLLLTLLSVMIIAKVGLDFSSGSYAHTGFHFRAGAHLLPVIMLAVFVHGWLTLPKAEPKMSESELT